MSGTTKSYTYVANGGVSDAQHVNQFVDILTATGAGVPGITVSTLTCLGAVSLPANSVATSSLTGTYLSTGATGTSNNIAIQSSSTGNPVVINANPATNPSNDTNVGIQLLPKGSGLVDLHYASVAVGGGA